MDLGQHHLLEEVPAMAAQAVTVALGLLLEVDKTMEVQVAVLDLGVAIKDQEAVVRGVPAKVQAAVSKVMEEATAEDLGVQVDLEVVTLGDQIKVLVEAVL